MFLRRHMSINRVLSSICRSLFIFILGNLTFTTIVASTIYAQNATQKLSEKDISLAEDEAKQTAAIWNDNSYRRAQLLYEKTAQDWLATGNLRRYAACLRKAAQLNTSLNELDVAWRMLSNSLSAERTAQNIAGESETLSSLTLIALWKKNLKSAEQLQKQAVALAEKSKQPEIIAKASFAAAEYFYRNQRNIILMQELQEKSLRLFREANDRTSETQTLTMLAYTAVMNNDCAKGQTYATEAINLARSTGNQRDLAFALIASGDAYQRVGNWQEAYQALKEAESIYPENLDFNEKAILFVRFGFHYETFSDLIQARSYFQKARELFIKRGNLYGNSELATRIGQISLQLGDKTEALKNFNEGLQIGIQSNDKYSLAYAYENIGELYFSNQEYKNAFNYYQKALVNFNEIGIKHAIASVKEKIGKLYLQQNNQQSAEKFYLEALQIYQDIRSKNGQAGNLYNLARIHQSEQQIETSLREIDECLRLTDFLHGETANKKLKQSYLADIFDRYELHIKLLMKMHRLSPNENYAIGALQSAEKSRARSILENLSLAEADFIKDAAPEIVKREKEIRVLLNSKVDKLTALLSNNADKAETEKLDGEINELEHELEEIKATLKQNSPIYSAIKNPAPFDVGELQSEILDENSLLLEFSFGKEESYLWLVGKTEVNSYILPPREQIESRIEKLRKLIDSRGMLGGETVVNYQARIATAETEFEREAQIFSHELLGQVADRLSNKRLIIVPDGKLHYFPIAALPFPNSIDNVPILLTNETVYEPSAATLALLMRNGKRISAAPKNLLVFSDPIFSNQDARIAAAAGIENKVQPETNWLKAENFRFAESLTSLARLNASRDEADAIVEIVGASESTALGGLAATRERALDASISDYKIIHFATHGLIDEERPELSGIVLSQVDETGQSRNGVVRLQDIYAMNLAADAVVLSACSTGIGKEVKGEGLLSLNNAFLQTGAKSVVASLWKVDDYAARELMKNFYLEMTSGTVTTAEALRRAQIKLRQNPQYQSPFYWAAFTVQGDFQNAPQLTAGLDYRIYGLSVLPFALILIYIYRRRAKLFDRKIINKR